MKFKSFYNLAERAPGLTLLAVLMAWVGIWGAWLPGPAASLRQNAIDLAEWSTFLLDARFGPLRATPDVLRFGLALAVWAAAASCVSISGLVERWLVRGVLLLPAVVMLPPPPALFDLWWSADYGLRFGACSLAFVGVLGCIASDRLPERWQHWLIFALCAGAIGCGLSAYLRLRAPFSAHFDAALTPGGGLILFVVGLGVAGAVRLWWGIQGRQQQPTP